MSGADATALYGGRYEDRVAVVSGASSGLGRQLSMDLARAGATVVAVARRTDLLEKLEMDLRAHSKRSRAYPCDVSDTQAWSALLRDVETEYGRIDLLINNAAYDPGVRLADISVADFEQTFAVNFFAAVAGTLAVLPGMIERGAGTVANVSSDGGRLPAPGPGAYPASKAALSAFTESVSFRVARRGVRMHVVYPAWMPTPMGLAAIERGLRRPPWFTRRTEEQVSRVVLRRLGSSSLSISASPLIDVAEVFRALAPRLYRRLRRYW